METYIELKKNCRKSIEGLIPYRFAIVGDSATQMMATAIKGKAWKEGLALHQFEADYDQIRAQVMDTDSELYCYKPQSVMLFMCAEKLYDRFLQYSPNDRSTFAEGVIEEIKTYWEMINTHIHAHIIQCTFREMNDMTFGNYAGKVDISFYYQIKMLNVLLMALCKEYGNVFPLCLDSIYARWGQQYVYDARLYYSAKMTLSEKILPVFAEQTIQLIKAQLGKIVKCVVCDLDNTLWGGVVGDIGYEKIEIGSLGKGAAFTALQKWLKDLKNRGILLAVCSKNQRETALEAFDKNAEMILKVEDFTVFIANWENKAENLLEIQKRINIGLDSIVFLDDNPFERNAVRMLIPEIIVPELPEDPANYVDYLQGLNLFETASYSEEDIYRTKQYQTEASRIENRAKYISYDEYLKSLNMVADAEPFNRTYLPRIAQLTQRSNQFNLRTIRYTEGELSEYIDNSDYMTLYFTLKDRYGDYGLISVVILQKQDPKTLFILEWLMSCRVLKKGMEEFIINKIVNTAKQQGYQGVIGEYVKSPKNAMVEDIYEKMGFTSIGGGKYLVNVDDFDEMKTYIKEENKDGI